MRQWVAQAYWNFIPIPVTEDQSAIRVILMLIHATIKRRKNKRIEEPRDIAIGRNSKVEPKANIELNKFFTQGRTHENDLQGIAPIPLQ